MYTYKIECILYNNLYEFCIDEQMTMNCRIARYLILIKNGLDLPRDVDYGSGYISIGYGVTANITASH